MLGLEGLGVLDKTQAFVENVVTADMLSPFKITIRHRPPFYRELLGFLQARGRDDLVNTIKRKLSDKQKKQLADRLKDLQKDTKEEAL